MTAHLGAGQIALLVGAAFAAGAVNAVAGGGSLISFPALLGVGYPAVTANVTNIIAVLPGYLGGSVAYRRELSGQGRRTRALALTTALGALAGSALLVAGSPGTFRTLAPYLVLLSCALLAGERLIRRLVERRRARGPAHRSPGLHLLLFAGSVYGGYFGAGLGIMLLAILGSFLDEDLQRVNALKGVLSLLVSVVSAAYFALFGPVAWPAAAIMAGAAFAGGTVGVGVARRLSAPVLHGAVIVLGVALAIKLLV